MAKIDDYRLQPKDDARVKITDNHKKEILSLYEQETAIREIARRFEGICSRKAITFIIFPEKLKRAKELYKERRKDGRYYDREKHTIAMRKHRKKKRELLTKNQLIKKHYA